MIELLSIFGDITLPVDGGPAQYGITGVILAGAGSLIWYLVKQARQDTIDAIARSDKTTDAFIAYTQLAEHRLGELAHEQTVATLQQTETLSSIASTMARLSDHMEKSEMELLRRMDQLERDADHRHEEINQRLTRMREA